jgi:hypothetical protein
MSECLGTGLKNEDEVEDAVRTILVKRKAGQDPIRIRAGLFSYQKEIFSI